MQKKVHEKVVMEDYKAFQRTYIAKTMDKASQL